MINTYYDSEKDEIVNATLGTWGYYHEEGHQHLRKKIEFVKTFFLMWINYLYFCIIGLILFDDVALAKLLFFIIIFMILMDEFYAWIYAFNKMVIKK